MPEPKARPAPRVPSPAGDPCDFHIRIRNRLEMVKPVRDLVTASCQVHGVDEDDMQEMLLAVSELVNNAIEHVGGGSAGEPHEVDVVFGVAAGMAVGRIVDEGEAHLTQTDFEGASRPDIDSDRGRGLFLIRAYVDEVHVRAIPGVGTEVKFVKRLRAGAGGAA